MRRSPAPDQIVLRLITKTWSADADGSIVVDLVGSASMPAKMATADPIAVRALAEEPGPDTAVYFADTAPWQPLDGIMLSIEDTEDTEDELLKPGLAARLRMRNGTPVPGSIMALANRAEVIVVLADGANVRDNARWKVVVLATAAAPTIQP